MIQVKGTWRSQGGIILAQKSPMTKEWNSPLKYCSFLCAQSLVHIKQYFWNLIYKMYFILEVWCKQWTLTIIVEGVAIGHTEILFFLGMKICVSGALARFARSRVLVNKWVRAFYSIEYNQSNINNGRDRPRQQSILTLGDFMKIYCS